MTTTKIALVVLGVIVGLLFSGAYIVNQSIKGGNVGGVYSTTLRNFESIKVGDNGGELTFIKAGTCNLTSDTSIAATSTGTGTCAITGALAGDIVTVSLATTSTNINSQFLVEGTVATTNSATVRLVNLTGVARVPASVSGFGSSTQYQIFRAR